MYLESVRSPVARQGFIFRQPAKQMNRSEIFSQAVVEQDSEYAFDSFCVDSDDAENLENTHWDEPRLTQLPPRAARARAQQIQANRPQIQANRQPTTSANVRRRKRIVYANSSSDESEDVTRPPKKSIKSEDSLVPQRSAIRPTPALSKLASNQVEPTMKLDVKVEGTHRPMNTTSMVPATDRAVFSPMPSSSSVTIKHFTTDSCSSSASSSRAASCSSATSSIVSNATPLSPPRTLLVSSRQLTTTTQVISSLQVKHRCLTHVCSFDVADFVLSSQLGVIRKLHSGKLEVPRKLGKLS